VKYFASGLNAGRRPLAMLPASAAGDRPGNPGTNQPQKGSPGSGIGTQAVHAMVRRGGFRRAQPSNDEMRRRINATPA